MTIPFPRLSKQNATFNSNQMPIHGFLIELKFSIWKNCTLPFQFHWDLSNMEQTLPQTTGKSAQTSSKESKLMDLWAMCGLTLTLTCIIILLRNAHFMYLCWLLMEKMEKQISQKTTLWHSGIFCCPRRQQGSISDYMSMRSTN